MKYTLNKTSSYFLAMLIKVQNNVDTYHFQLSFAGLYLQMPPMLSTAATGSIILLHQEINSKGATL
jgi:hypothetical protein